MFDEAAREGEAEFPPECLHELLAGASFCLAGSLKQVGAEGEPASDDQRRATDMLNQAIKLVHEAATLTNNGSEQATE